MTKYYITRYVLSTGIEEFDFPAKPDADGHLWYIDNVAHRHHSYSANDWHLRRDEAVSQAKLQRDKKIASLKKQITKLEKMTFGEPSDAR